MRVALCLYGHSRTTDSRGLKIDWAEAVPYFKKNLIDLHDVDVFIHTWGDPLNEELRQDLVRDFAPAAIQIEKSIFPNYDVSSLNLDISFYSGIREGSKRVQAAMSRWDSQKKSNDIKMHFEKQNDIKYDFVVSCRFDLLLYQPFPFGKMAPENYYVSNWHAFWKPEDRFYGYQDCWFVSGNKNTNIYCSMFDNLLDYWQDNSDLADYCVNFLKKDNSTKFSSHVISRWHMINKGLISFERFYGVEYDTWSLLRKRGVKNNPHWDVPWGSSSIFNPAETIEKILKNVDK